MIVPLVLLLLSLAGVAATLSDPVLADYRLLAALAVLASLILLAKGYAARRSALAEAARKWIVIDGSNVMHENDGVPQIRTVREVVRYLAARGYTAGVVFDANAGYLLDGRYRHDRAFGRQLGLPEDRIMVVPKGTPADPTVLTVARDFGAQVVSNDRFRDWAAAFPEVKHPGHLIRGEYRAGKLWIDLPQAEPDGRAAATAG